MNSPHSRQSRLQEDTTFRVLRLLQVNPNLSQRDLAKQLGISLGGLNYCLQALLDKGWIKMRSFQKSDRKLAYSYLLTPAGLAEKAGLTARFIKRKMEEYEQLRLEIESLRRETEEIPDEARPVPVSATTSEQNRLDALRT